MTSFIDMRKLLLGGTAMFALTAAGAAPAFAQDDAATQEQGEQAEDQAAGDVIVVSGYRAALAESIATKREMDVIVESISAEDIGKLPDNSIAEAIARLPGLTAQRIDGRAQVISIRGLAPDFSTTLLNGREQVTTGDNRGIEFDQYPSELIGRVDVYKTPHSGLIGQGLSGTVDLRTIRPLEYGRRALSVSARGEKVSLGELNSGSTDTGYRVSATYIDQFANDTIGVMLGAAHMVSPSQIERYNSWGYPTLGDGGPFVIGGSKPYVQSNELTRTGVIGSIEFQPSSNFNTRIDAYYSKFKDEQILRGIELPLLWGGLALQPGYTVEDGLVTEGTFAGAKGIVRNDANTRDSDLYSLGWNAEYETGRWTLIGDVSYSRVDRKDTILETYAGTSRGAGSGPYDTIGFTFDPEGFYRFDTGLDYSDPGLIQLTSPQGWGGDIVPGGQDGYLNMPSIKDELTAFRGSANYALGGGIDSIEVGANFTMRSKSYTPDEFFLSLAANVADPDHNTSVPIPQDALLDPTELAYLGIPGMVAYDPIKLIDSGIYDLIRNSNNDVGVKGWSVNEDVLTGWVKANIDQPVGDNGSLTGNIGLQVVYTDQSSEGFANGNIAVNEGSKYTELLPSMNLSFRFDDANVLRFGLARTLARPRMEQMKASFNFNTTDAFYNSTDPTNAFFSGDGGNPHVRPWIADSVDISYEHYFSPEAYVAVAGFYKYLETYIYKQNILYDFTGFDYTPPPGAGPEPGTFLGRVNAPANGSGGTIYGLELSGTLPFNLFTGALDGFGVVGSYSYTESSIQPDPNNPSQPLPGLSKHVANGTVYFEKSGFSARASVRHRSKFLAEVVGFGVSRVNRTAKGETIIDAQIGYEFQDGPLEGLGILLQGQNLTDEPFITYENGDLRRVIDYQRYGRRYLLGLSYKF